MTPRLSKIAARRAINTVFIVGALSTVTPVYGQAQQAITQVSIPISDARKMEPDAVRFAAIQASSEKPTIVLLGGNKAAWQMIVAAAKQATTEGYPVRGIFVGPTNVEPSLEIYAKGRYVTKPLNPNTIKQDELVKLIRDVHNQFFSK